MLGVFYIEAERKKQKKHRKTNWSTDKVDKAKQNWDNVQNSKECWFKTRYTADVACYLRRSIKMTNWSTEKVDKAKKNLDKIQSDKECCYIVIGTR